MREFKKGNIIKGDDIGLALYEIIGQGRKAPATINIKVKNGGLIKEVKIISHLCKTETIDDGKVSRTPVQILLTGTRPQYGFEQYLWHCPKNPTPNLRPTIHTVKVLPIESIQI